MCSKKNKERKKKYKRARRATMRTRKAFSRKAMKLLDQRLTKILTTLYRETLQLKEAPKGLGPATREPVYDAILDTGHEEEMIFHPYIGQTEGEQGRPRLLTSAHGAVRKVPKKA